MYANFNWTLSGILLLALVSKVLRHKKRQAAENQCVCVCVCTCSLKVAAGGGEVGKGSTISTTVLLVHLQSECAHKCTL